VGEMSKTASLVKNSVEVEKTMVTKRTIRKNNGGGSKFLTKPPNVGRRTEAWKKKGGGELTKGGGKPLQSS